jgi:hypothetical protein
MAKTITETFKSPPEKVRDAITEAVKEQVPDFAYLLKWDGTSASGSKFGAKGRVDLVGEGPTTMTLTFSIGFPASLKYSEEEAGALLRKAIQDLKTRVP